MLHQTMFNYPYLLLILLLVGCADLSFECIDDPNLDNRSDSEVFYMIDVDNECEYTIVSPCEGKTGKLKFDGSSFYISLKEVSGFIQLFEFEEGKESIAVANCDTELRGTSIKFHLEKRYVREDEKIHLIKVSRNPDLAVFGSYDYYFFLSDKSGVIGSYLTSNSRSDMIFQKRGDILSPEINYEKMEFRDLE